MKTYKPSLAIALALTIAAGDAAAQTSPVRPSYQFPSAGGQGRIQLGTSPVYATPYASLGYGNDSNLTLSPGNEIDTPYQVSGGGVTFDARDSRSVFKGDIRAAYGRYSDSTQDNYSDWGSSAAYDFAFDERNFIRLNWDYVRGHEGRGTTDRQNQSGPDKYSTNTPGVLYAYGARGAQGRFEAFASRNYRRYLNNREATAGSDRDTRDYGGAFYWRMAPKTSFLAEARGTDIKYLASTSTLSSSESRYYGGVTWDATAATSGTIKVGYLEKRYDSVHPSFSGTGWEGMVTWMPRSYSKVDVFSSRQPAESTGVGDFILSDATGILWTHAWTSVVSTDANAKYVKDSYKGFDRTDETQIYGLKANYKVRRWLTLGAEYQFTRRDSTIDSSDYDKTLWMISAILSM
jgi:hypothetical protein